MHESSADTVTPDDEFLNRVRRAGASVLGDSETGRQVRSLCGEHVRARHLISQDRAAGALVLAVVGATGQGKSWLIRQLIRRSPLAASIRSGNNADQATEELVWVGPHPPVDLDPRFERFVRVSSADMEPIGTPYMLVDAPGATDNRQGIAEVAKRALSLASAIVLVVRRDQIRGQTPAALAVASEGTIVIPVINTIGVDDAALHADIDAFLANLRTAAPESVIARPVRVTDFELGGESEQQIGAQAATELLRQLQIELENNPDSDRRKSTRLAALDGRFRSALSALLADELPGLTRAVNRLNDEATKLPGEVAQTLIGPDGPMQAAVRSRLRLKLLTSTGAIWFPYRSVLGLLNLTHGAWDRVLLSLSGSLPSLVSTIWTSTRSLTSDRNANEELRDGLQRRSAAAVTDRLGPLAAQFREELALLRNADQRDDGKSLPGEPLRVTSHSETQQVASLAGIDALQERSHKIFEDAVEQNSISQLTAMIMAIVGTLIFWLLMAGPFVALYGEYLTASYETLIQVSTQQAGETQHPLEHFPKPEFAMVLTSLVLSLLPTAIFSMIALSVAQSNGRTQRAQQAIRQGHEDAITQLQQDRVLRLRWDDPLLTDAEFLVSAGRR
ncbi:GTPase domain-containing protein [Stieleria sp. ICT_E10.1]|uniref:GTPase domain-containing protein n=1 Tax=Stieleria sedimenti TaxID=2976331 RepID=UPI0021805A8C|nr:GTPase domain-containing protein [Stieleria sedimenti]MCS7466879.1 GTPase domain-containing protein [Stieleria sedimenti]